MATVQVPFSPHPNPSSPFAHRFSTTHHKFPSPPPPSTFSPAHPQSQSSPSRWQSPNKRKHDDDDDEYAEQDDRDRENSGPRKIAGGKRARRGGDTPKPGDAGERQSAHGGSETKSELEEVDMGVLLASLPQSSLLPLLTSLLASTPSLKAQILALMPRPSTSAVTAALNTAYQKVQAAYPYASSSGSASPFAPTPAPAPAFVGFAAGAPFQPTPVGSFGFGLGASGGSFGFGAANQQQQAPRDTFARARLRQPVQEFVTTVLSYLPYFSLNPSTASSSTATNSHNPTPAPTKSTPHALETFTYLHHATTLSLSLLALFPPPAPPPQALTDLLARLHAELAAWSRAVDEHVNAKGGMFGGEMVRGWARGLDELAELGRQVDAQAQAQGQQHQNQHQHGQSRQQAQMHGGEWAQLRDQWVIRCGWLIGRWLQPQQQQLGNGRDQDVEL